MFPYSAIHPPPSDIILLHISPLLGRSVYAKRGRFFRTGLLCLVVLNTEAVYLMVNSEVEVLRTSPKSQRSIAMNHEGERFIDGYGLSQKARYINLCHQDGLFAATAGK